MLTHRLVVLIGCILVIGGSLAASVGYATFIHSDRYRLDTVRRLSETLGFEADVAKVQPLSLHSRRFNGVTLRLPEQGLEVFACEQALWREVATEGPGRFSLELSKGRLLLGTDRWAANDYERLLQSGLGHDFNALGLRDVYLANMDLEWIHPEFRLRFEDAFGEVQFDEQGTARVNVNCRRLNDAALDDLMNVAALLTPGPRLSFHEVVLNVPRLPLCALEMDQLFAGTISRGAFVGRLTYRESEGSWSLQAEGELTDGDIREWTSRVIGGPFSGTANVVVDQFLFTEGRVDEVRFGGSLSNMRVSEIAPFLRSTDNPGRIDLRVYQADFAGDSLRYLSLGGEAEDVSMERVTELLGYGVITGRLRLLIHELRVVDDRIDSADVELFAEPHPGQAATIDRAVIVRVGRELLGLDISIVLPEQIEYARLGVRLVLDHGRLYVRGTHGKERRTILTVRLLNREWAVLTEPSRAFEIPDDLLTLEGLQARFQPYAPSDIRSWWEQHHHAPTR